MQRTRAAAFAVTLTCASVLLPLASVPADADFQAVPIGTFENPVYVAVAPGRPRLLFVVERRGRIQVLSDEQRLSPPFLDITDFVFGMPDQGAGAEQGLLSVAFSPDYQTSGRFYVAFTRSDWALEISEFRRSARNHVRADRTTRRVLLVIPHPGARNHNGGQLQFGPDGFLYISTGDGGGLTPPGEPARDLSSLLGKILRIDPLPAGMSEYGIPNDNPFVGQPGRRGEIFAYGLRHPWRFSFDRSRIAIADVGRQQREEVNFLAVSDAAGVNFGWPQYEGELVFDNDRAGPHPPKFPILTYAHTNGRCAIIGGYVVRDPDLPTLARRYLYGDLCTGEVRSFIPMPGRQKAVDDRPTGVVLPQLSSFGRGFNGQIYFAQISGEVSRLEPSPP